MNNIILYIFLCFFSLTASAKIVDSLKQEKDFSAITDLNSVQSAFNTSPVTANIKQCFYNPKTICKIRIRERMPVVIKTEYKIITMVLGDSNNFKTKIIDNSKKLLRVKAIIPGSDTSLVLVDSNNNLISFYIRVDSVKSDITPDFIVNVVNADIKKNIKANKLADKKETNKLDDKNTKSNTDNNFFQKKPIVDLASINSKYKIISGNKSIKPLDIYDDGVWTYFKYGDDDLSGVDILPVVWQVIDGYDTPVNNRVSKGVLIAESISKKWTLRAGNKHICVRAE